MTDTDFSIHRKIDVICDDFENQWSADSRVDISVFLERIEPEARERLLAMLLEIDIELRLKANQKVATEDYEVYGENAVAHVQNLLDAPQVDPATIPPSDSPDPDFAMTSPRTSSPSPPNQIGPYKLLQQIGEGGMGTVWMAEQEKPVRRRVALKVIKAGMDSKQVITRFEVERQALAMMDHQNIARVLDVGMTDDGRPFFAMELVQGIPFNQYCDTNKLSLRERLELFVPVCNAVQHAHQKGIIHRDLKPSNVLVTQYDGKPVPKVIDFGLAKALQHQTQLTDKTLFTEFGQVIGTLQYMSPEQAEMNALDVDTRTDIYSLGVMLYELLTGSTPLDRDTLRGQALLELLKTIREKDPPRPSARLSDSGDAIAGISQHRKIEPKKLQQILRGELDWVVMKALEKDRTRRYETASGLASDIANYLNGQPIAARPPSQTYLLRKYVRRNKGLVASLAAITIMLLLAITGTSWGMIRARKNAVRAEAREEQAITAVKGFRDAVANNSELKNNPALEELRRTLLKEPLAFFRELRDQLQAETDTRPEALARLGLACFELGSLNDEIGDKQKALEAHREALGIYEELVEAHPSVASFKRQLEHVHHNLGHLLQRTGNPHEALTEYETALRLQRQLIDAHPKVTEYKNDLARSYLNKGLLLSIIGDDAEALEWYKASVATWRQLVSSEPNNIQFQSDLAITQNNLAIVLAETGKQDEALTSWRATLEIQKELAAANPKDNQLQCDMATTYNNLGFLLSQTSTPEKAFEAFNSALKIQSELVKSSPSVFQFQSDLARTHVNVGKLLNQTGKPDKALDLFKSSLEIQTRLANGNPTVTKLQQELAWSHQNIGVIEYQAGRVEEALAQTKKALEVHENLATKSPEVADFQNDLATAQSNLGGMLYMSDRMDEGLTHSNEALAIRQKLADKYPDVDKFQSGLARSCLNLGEMLSETGKSAEARECYERALTVFRAITASVPENWDYASKRGHVLESIAIIDLAEQRFAVARDLLLEAVEWQNKALSVNPTNQEVRNLLASQLMRLMEAEIGLDNAERVAAAEEELSEVLISDPQFDAIEARLVAVKDGEAPNDNAERIELAQRAFATRRFALSTRFYDEAFGIDSRLTTDPKTQNSYNAACSAALAGTGRGFDEPKPDASTRTQFREQARQWLQSELTIWKELLENAGEEAHPAERKRVAEILERWQSSPDLAAVRDSARLEELPEAERIPWKSLWSDVETLQQKASSESPEHP